MKASIFRTPIAVLLLAAAFLPILALAAEGNQMLIEKVAQNAQPFEYMDVTFTEASHVVEKNETKVTRHRLRLDRKTGAFRREELLETRKPGGIPNPEWLVYRVQTWNGSKRVLVEQLVEAATAKLGNPVIPGDGVIGTERPQVTLPFTDIYEHAPDDTLANWLLQSKDVQMRKLSDATVELLIQKQVRLVVDAESGLIQVREDLTSDEKGRVYAFVSRVVKSNFDADVLYFPAEVEVTWRNETGTIKVDKFTVVEEALRVNVPMDESIFNINLPRGVSMIDSNTGKSYRVGEEGDPNSN